MLVPLRGPRFMEPGLRDGLLQRMLRDLWRVLCQSSDRLAHGAGGFIDELVAHVDVGLGTLGLGHHLTVALLPALPLALARCVEYIVHGLRQTLDEGLASGRAHASLTRTGRTGQPLAHRLPYLVQ